MEICEMYAVKIAHDYEEVNGQRVVVCPIAPLISCPYQKSGEKFRIDTGEEIFPCTTQGLVDKIGKINTETLLLLKPEIHPITEIDRMMARPTKS